MANRETFRQVGDRFDHPRGYAHYIFKQGCQILTSQATSQQLIQWPSTTEIDKLVAS